MHSDFPVDSQSFQEPGKHIDCGCLWLLLLFLGFLPVECFDLGTLFDLRSEGEPLCPPIDIELDFSGSNINVCVYDTQEWPSQNEGRLVIDFHVEDDEINGNKEVPDFNQNVLCNSRGVTDCLVR